MHVQIVCASKVDGYLRGRTPPGLPAELAKRVMLPPAEAKLAGTSVNGSLVNALVLYVGESPQSLGLLGGRLRPGFTACLGRAAN